MTEDAHTLMSVPDDYQVPPPPPQQQVPITIHTTGDECFYVRAPDSWTWADQGVIFATGQWARGLEDTDVMIPLTNVKWIQCHFDLLPQDDAS